MKNQNNQRLQSLLLTTIATIFLLSAFNSTFAQGSGAKYEARDPKTCADTKKPTRGAMSAAQATEYIICGKEKDEGGHLTLVENLKVQVGGATAYNRDTFGYTPDVDPKAPVYPVRASLNMYQCNEVSDAMENRGKSCTVYVRPKATGVCVKTTFGDWRCTLSGFDVGGAERKFKMPPPGGTTAVAKDKPTDPKDTQQPVEPKVGGAENKDDVGFPKPDFSEMEKWYEVVKYEYAPFEQRLYFWVKTNLEPGKRGHSFNLVFRDKDGIKLQPEFTGPNLGYVEVNELTKLYFDIPTEKTLRQAATAKVVRNDP